MQNVFRMFQVALETRRGSKKKKKIILEKLTY